MSIELGPYTFAGPFEAPESLQDRPGLWAVHDWVNTGFYLFDLGEADSVRDAVSEPARLARWESRRKGTLTFSALYKADLAPEGRRALYEELKAGFPPASEAWR